MRRRVVLTLIVLGVVAVAMLALVAAESNERDALPKSDLPSAHNGASIAIAPRVIAKEGHQTVRINAPNGMTYGQTYEIDQYVDGRWRYILIGGQPPNESSVSRPFSPKTDAIFTAEVFTGRTTFQLSVAEGPGDYRIRKAMIDSGPGDDFEIAAVFRISGE